MTASRKRKPSLRHHVAARVRHLREARGWSQEELAEQSGLHRTHVSLIERAACNLGLDNLERLAAAFGVPAAVLLSTGPHSLPQWPLLLVRETPPAYASAR